MGWDGSVGCKVLTWNFRRGNVNLFLARIILYGNLDEKSGYADPKFFWSGGFGVEVLP